MDAKVESLYRSILTDLTVDQEESQDIIEFFASLNPPPDKLVWLRATAFKIGCEFLSEDDADKKIALLRAINAIVHSLEFTCMVYVTHWTTSGCCRAICFLRAYGSIPLVRFWEILIVSIFVTLGSCLSCC